MNPKIHIKSQESAILLFILVMKGREEGDKEVTSSQIFLWTSLSLFIGLSVRKL